MIFPYPKAKKVLRGRLEGPFGPGLYVPKALVSRALGKRPGRRDQRLAPGTLGKEGGESEM